MYFAAVLVVVGAVAALAHRRARGVGIVLALSGLIAGLAMYGSAA